MRRRASLYRRLRRGSRRGAALPTGALLIVASVLVLALAWQKDRDALRLAEMDRERGRIWGMTCVALHRAVQSGLVTTARTVTPAELRGWSLLPAGLGAVERAGGTVATAGYGTVMAGTVPLAACSLSGPELGFRAPALRAGAVMGGLDLVGVVGGDTTRMHDRLTAVRAVLGTLPAGSMFMTADFGIGHEADRLHRREIGGRPELGRMETDLVFGPNTGIGDDLLPAAGITDGVAVVAGEDCTDATLADARRCFDMDNVGSIAGIDAGANGASRFGGLRAEIGGNVSVGRTGQAGTLSFGPSSEADKAATGFSAGGGFQFGDGTGTQTFNLPQALTVGAGLSSEGAVSAGSMAVSGQADVGGGLTARSRAGAATLTTGGDLGANSGSFTGNVMTGGCDGCDPPFGG